MHTFSFPLPLFLISPALHGTMEDEFKSGSKGRVQPSPPSFTARWESSDILWTFMHHSWAPWWGSKFRNGFNTAILIRSFALDDPKFAVQRSIVSFGFCDSFTSDSAPLFGAVTSIQTQNSSSTLQKQSRNFSKAFGYYSCMTIFTMQILWMQCWKLRNHPVVTDTSPPQNVLQASHFLN